MSLLVLDPDVATSQSLGHQICAQLTDLGFKTIDASDPRIAAKLIRQGQVEMVICCNAGAVLALDRVAGGVGFVVATATPLDAITMLDMMRHGVHDCWEFPLADALLCEYVDALNARMQTLLADLDSEITGLRSELERDQRAGQHVQMGMLPPNPMGIGHFHLQHRVEPSLILSGDFIDYFQITERYFACYVADVAGHGASSAFVTVLLKNFSRRLRREYRQSMLRRPGEILAWINNELLDQGIDKHVAMFFAVVDTRDAKLHYANAAHLPPAALVYQGRVTNLEQKAKPLGLFNGIQFESLSVDFPAGARLVVFSDGVLDLIAAESLAAKEAFLTEVVRTTTDIDGLWSDLSLQRMGPDDVSCLVVEHLA